MDLFWHRKKGWNINRLFPEKNKYRRRYANLSIIWYQLVPDFLKAKMIFKDQSKLGMIICQVSNLSIQRMNYCWHHPDRS